MKMSKMRQMVGNLGNVRKVRGQNKAVLTMYKNWGHGSPTGGKSGGVLGRLTLAGVRVTGQHFGNQYELTF